MIDVNVEQLLDINQAARHPAFRNTRTGKAAHVSSIFRYALYGGRAVNGQRIKLETVKVPSGLRTSVEAIERFIAALTCPEIDPPRTTSAARRKQIEMAEKELAEAGF